MIITNSAKNLKNVLARLKSRNKTIGFVPTMGALHNGHLSLIRKSRRENDIVVLSIFVNPKQFSPKEDFSKYPRPEKKDELLAKKEKVDIIFHPSEKEMYPAGYLTNIHVEKLDRVLCGKFRSGHFKGVTTIVGKLLNIVSPSTLYMGQKDAQQTVIINKMITDLNMPVKLRVCPIVREKDGLALSSRNSYLSEKQRKEAVVLYASLTEAKKSIQEGCRSAKAIIRRIESNIKKCSSGRIQYVECVKADTLEHAKKLEGRIMIALAVYFGRTRLIDNLIIKV